MADKSVGELIAAKSVTPTDLFVLEQNGTAKKLTGQVLENWLVSFANGHGGIQSIVKHSTSGLNDTYRITLADTTTFDFIVTNGKAISSVEQTSEEGLTRTYTIAFNDNTSQTFTVTDGRSITNIEKTATNVLTDTYTISYNDGTSSIFTVKNGRGIRSFEKVSTVELVDTYRITYNDGTSDEFTVTNGEKGDKGDNTYTHIKYASQEPTEESHSFGDIPDQWIGLYWGNSAEAPTDWTLYKWYQFKGEKGDTGNPATLNSSVVEYQVSDSGTIIPSGVWSASVPVVAQGKYLWTRTTNMFNTGSPAVSYSVSRMGLDGSGSVSSVANISPDENGNVPLTAENIGAMPNTGGDLTGELRMNGQPISGLNAPMANDQAANMGFVNQQMKKAAPRNLLDNSDFRNPVNQRGQKSFTTTGRAIDRWVLTFAGDRGISLSDDGIVLNTTSTLLWFNINICEKERQRLVGKTVTLAVTDVEGNVYCNSGIMDVPHTDMSIANIFLGDKVRVDCYSSTHSGDFQVRFTAQPINTPVTIRNVALYEGEYTIDTLPEYQPKGYDAELLACQTQLQRFRTESERKTYCEDFRPTMRMTLNGMVSKFEQEIDGVTHYFASAEL